MAGYRPQYVRAFETGLVQNRQLFILPEDAYPILENAYVYRETIRRKEGIQLLGQFTRALTAASFGSISAGGAGKFSFNIISGLITATSINASEANANIVPGNLNNFTITLANGQTISDTTGTGTLVVAGAGVVTAAIISYASGLLTLTFSGAIGATAATYTGYYYPALPVMGLRTQDITNATFDNCIGFDTVYAYQWNGTQWVEFLPGTTWTGSNSQFFWTTNYYLTSANFKVFWTTNFKDPIRYTNGVPTTNWINFTPQIDTSGNLLQNALCLLPFRGRLVAFNTSEGLVGPGSPFSNRIRWSAIGNPFTVVSAINSTVNPMAWRDDIRGQGGYLDIPTNEDIVSVGFVRDNLVVFCERSTWQLRYTGRSIAPFQIEKVNTENGIEGTFSTVQFDTSLVGIGDRGIIECDSYKAERIDIKIPDLVFDFQNINAGPERIYGIRNFERRLAYWTYASAPANGTFPDKRLVYNYENDSWAIFDDSFTCFGNFQQGPSRTWLNTPKPWVECNFPWVGLTQDDPDIIAGNQQGYTFYIDRYTVNDPSLSISAITGNIGNTPDVTVLTVPNHNFQTGAIIQISGLLSTDPFFDLNNNVYSVIVIDANNFQLMIYDPDTGLFSKPQLDLPNTGYIGLGKIAVLDNFNITSKKFNFLDNGQSIQFGYFDILMNATDTGAISLNLFVDYQDDDAINTTPQNDITNGVAPIAIPDTFFNAIIPTSQSSISGKSGSKFWQRVFCPTRGNFITLQFTFSNAQMAGEEVTKDVQIDSQVIWTRPAGRLTSF